MSTRCAMNIAPNTTFSFVVSNEHKNGLRIDRYISDQFPFYSRSFFQQLIIDGLVGLNGQPVSKQSLQVKESDIITITFPPERQVDESVVFETMSQKKIDVEIIAEHEHFIIISKPANLLVHRPSIRSNAITLVDWLLVHYPELASIGSSDRAAIVHRLDKDTSGIMVIPRTVYAYKVFGDMFRNREIHKTYHAIVHGNPANSGSIDFSIGRDPYNHRKMAAFATANTTHPVSQNTVYTSYTAQNCQSQGKRLRTALTHYRVLEHFDNHALVEVKLVTGRMHQIRVHFAAIGNPVFGDPVYGNKSSLIDRQALHAAYLSFKLGNEHFKFSNAAPDDFQKLLKKLKRTQ